MEILDSYLSFTHPSANTLAILSDYFNWQEKNSKTGFTPNADDDVDLRTYLNQKRSDQADPQAHEERTAALKHFYHWAHTTGIITNNPFDEYNFNYPATNNTQFNPRPQHFSSDQHARELEMLRALAKITDELNGAVNIQDALSSTLRTMLAVLKLQTGWVSMLTESHLNVLPVDDPAPHGFKLAAAIGLPPGLEQDDRRFLRQAPACRCQRLLVQGRLTRPVNIVECSRLRDSQRAQGNNQGLLFHACVPLISEGKPVGLINAASAEWQFLNHADLHFLSTVSSHLVRTLERAKIYETTQARRNILENEMKVARQVQSELMPGDLPELPGFTIASAWHPAREVAGDLYDIFQLDDGRWGLVIGDVSGKSTAAALYMAMVHSLILSAALRNRNPATVLLEVNQTILRQTSSSMFVTVFYGVLDINKQTFRYANAGHNPALLRRSVGKTQSLAPTAAALGVFDNLEISTKTIKLQEGDALLLYTDGVTEAWHSKRNEAYGDERLETVFCQAPRQAKSILAHMQADLLDFYGGEPLQDDVTFFVVSKD